MELYGSVQRFISKWEIVEIVELNSFTCSVQLGESGSTGTGVGLAEPVSVEEEPWSVYVNRRRLAEPASVT